MKVIKFGGSSLANGAAVAQAVRIIQADPARQVIVTSAPGKRHHDDTKVTDLLIQYAQLVQTSKILKPSSRKFLTVTKPLPRTLIYPQAP